MVGQMCAAHDYTATNELFPDEAEYDAGIDPPGALSDRKDEL